MPHKVFNTGSQNANIDLPGVPLVPGIDPGGSRLGNPLKPALLITNLYAELQSFNSGGAAQQAGARVYLKLSQELDMTPGLILPILEVNSEVNEETAVSRWGLPLTIFQHGHEHIGKVWVPKMVGIRLEFVNTFTVNVDVHIDYERILIPFMDWFIGWDFLDNVVDNSRDY